MSLLTSPDFTQLAESYRCRIDDALSAYASYDAGCPDVLVDAIRYALLAPGKRLRPTLVLMAAEACGGTIDDALPAACAVEMVHAYSLVHDDLPAMDDDDLRRGRPTCHKEFGEAIAILAGDALLTQAFEVISRDASPPELAAQCCVVLARAAGPCGMVGGQADDLTADAEVADIETLEWMHRRKTGVMFEASLRLGGLAGGATDAQVAALANFGRTLGLAFQIIDDLLDVAGSEEDTGKRVGKDTDHGKLTFPMTLGVEESRARAASLIDEACEALEPLGETAGPLRSLARFVIERNR
ncbi:MAG: polyprenyl synthetase family protein [Pirellulales bacterium]|nr:polyprenyl synthetase family protein [Pirellulales bacterium]